MEGRSVLDKTLLIVLTVIVVAIVGIAALAYFVIAPMIYNNPLPIPTSIPYPGTSRTSSPTTPVTESIVGTTSTTQGVGIDISGYWHGVYDSRSGSSGEFTFYFRKSGSGFTGYLNITDVAGKYVGENIPISVTIEGNTIKLGWVAAGASFTGTISGDYMEGTWSLSGNLDSGTWSARRGYKDIFTETKTETPITETVTTEETTVETTTRENPFDQAQDINAPQEIEFINNDIKSVLTSFYGGAKLTSITTQGNMYYLIYTIPVQTKSSDVDAIANSLSQLGYEIISKASASGDWILQATIERQGVIYTLTLGANADDQYVVAYISVVQAS